MIFKGQLLSPGLWRPARTMVFLATSLSSSVLMHLLLRAYDSAFCIPVGLLAAFTGIAIGWSAVSRWREAAPLRCWASLGFCAGLGGAGVLILVVHTVLYLTTPVGIRML